MNSAPPITLLMPNRNNAAILDEVLVGLSRNTTYPNAELVVVDDESSDASRAILRRWWDSGAFANFKLIERTHTPGGVVDALNEGLGRADGELVVQLDADASVQTPGWLERMSSFLLSDPRIGVLSAKIVFDWGEIHTCGVDVLGPDGFHDRGAEITEPVGERTYHQRVLRRPEGQCAECEGWAEVDGGIGCCMIYRRDLALQIGGYDDGYAPVWFDDLDLTLCIRREGLKAFFTPEVRVVHHVGRRMANEAPYRRMLRGIRKAAGRALPPDTRRRVSQRLDIDRPPREQWHRLLHHYDYFRRKWGFDMLNPELEDLRRRWGGTELCWRMEPDMRAAGEQILSSYLQATAKSAR